ncbi:hypothetical protein ABZ858_21235 [Streptomyces sp. NPDC047017]|uniref:hypothetical protein n=1 Tax=Streptomyces sp. NPDC047017 TaxID=3155024 RepID=UPI0034017831
MSAPVESRRQPAPRGAHRPRAAVPARATTVEPARDADDLRVLLDHLDGQIITLVLRRAELARHYQAQRRTAGLPQSELNLENEMLRRYAELLGRKGTDIGRAVLALSQAGPRPRRD